MSMKTIFKLSYPTTLVVMAIIIVLLSACNKKQEFQQSAYYWSTVFSLDSTQLSFLKQNSIDRLYIRYFDVVNNPDGSSIPNATLRFLSQVPDNIEVVPTVYILNECMSHGSDNLDSLVLHRILQMNQTHDIAGVKEIQIDCDWTINTRDNFFNFLKKIVNRARKHNIAVSATIRLHQLSQPVPPVERGTLMVYNTGDITKLNSRNPILDMRDVKPYLKNLRSYNLSMNVAYPVFAWKVVFRNGKYVGIIHSDDDMPIFPSDTIIEQSVALDEIVKVKNAINKLRPEINNDIILFDISQSNIKRINKYHYEKIYNH